MLNRSVIQKFYRNLEIPMRFLVIVFMVVSALMVQAQSVRADDAFTIILQDGLDSYSGTRDTYLWDSEPGIVRGTESTFIQDKNVGDERRSLLLFDLSDIPTDATITSAELQFYVDTEGQGFNMYRMLKTWDEATITYTSNGGHFAANGTDAESAVNANWPGDDGYIGFITVAVPAETIQDWIDGTLTNNGWLMIATHADDGQQLASREYATQADRPKLTVDYTMPPPAGPTITVAGTPLSAFSSQPGVPSAAQTYTVSGSALTEDIVITAPTDFEISTDGSNYFSSRTLIQSGGSVGTTTIYVRFNRSTEGTSNGNVIHTSAAATTRNVAVSGEAANLPTTFVFQDGLDGYSGTRDTYLWDSDPSVIRGS